MQVAWVKIPERAKVGRPSSAKEYRSRIAELAKKEFPKPWSGELTVVLLYVLEKRPGEEPDLDNLTKPILDALKGIAYADDYQANPYRAERFYCGERVVTSAPILPPADALQKTAQLEKQECVFVGIASPRF